MKINFFTPCSVCNMISLAKRNLYLQYTCSCAEQQCERIGQAAHVSSNLEYSFYCSSILHHLSFFPCEKLGFCFYVLCCMYRIQLIVSADITFQNRDVAVSVSSVMICSVYVYTDSEHPVLGVVAVG
jgi:hypothetical protein